MPQNSSWNAHRQEIFDRETSTGRTRAAGLDRAEDHGYLYRRGEVLVDGATADELQRVSQDSGFSKKSDLDSLGIDLQRWAIPANADPLEVLSMLRQRKISPVIDINHVYSGEYAYRGGPANAPKNRDPLPFPAPTTSMEPDVAVLDTGVFLPQHRMIHQVQNIGEPDQYIDRLDEDRNQLLDSQAGHGTFICGIIRQRGHDLVIEQRRVLDAQGYGSDFSIAKGLASVKARVVNLSLGTYTKDDRPPVGVARAMKSLQKSGHLLVAAAGNNGLDRPFWPAAFAGVIAVAATTADGERAPFSNYGDWVDVSAPGVDISSCYVEHFHNQSLTGWASWSGTSFATPQVAAKIAHMVKSGVEPQLVVSRFLGTLEKARSSGLGRWFNQVEASLASQD